MYPIRFHNLYHQKIWGGRDMEEFRDNLPEGNIGESWDIACHGKDTGVVANGKYKGETFKELIEKLGPLLLGERIPLGRLPLLVKLINSREKLSVQVHPHDDYALREEGDMGKTEAWYVISAKAGATIIAGVKTTSKEELRQSIINKELEALLNVIPVSKGDAFLIKSGLIHAIGEGVIIAEIQQSSNVTYRVYDYGRPRELHIDKALEVVRLDYHCESLKENAVIVREGYKKGILTSNDYFSIERIAIQGEYFSDSNKDRFEIITAVEGFGLIHSNSFSDKIKLGDSYLIPASLGPYSIQGNITVLRSWPEITKK